MEKRVVEKRLRRSLVEKKQSEWRDTLLTSALIFFFIFLSATL